MATFYSALLALGTGSGSTFVEMVGASYAQQAVAFGTPNEGGRSPCLSTASWTPTGTWPPATQLAIVDVSGAVIMTLNFTNPITFVANVPNTIAPGRLSISLPLPIVSASLSYDSGGSAG